MPCICWRQVIPAAAARKWAGSGPIDWAGVVFRRRGAAAEALKSDSGRRFLIEGRGETAELRQVLTVRANKEVLRLFNRSAKGEAATTRMLGDGQRVHGRCGFWRNTGLSQARRALSDMVGG